MPNRISVDVYRNDKSHTSLAHWHFTHFPNYQIGHTLCLDVRVEKDGKKWDVQDHKEEVKIVSINHAVRQVFRKDGKTINTFHHVELFVEKIN